MAYNATNLNPTATSYTFSSVSGVDIKMVFHGRVIGEVQSFSYRLQRQIVPVYTLGTQYARSFGYGTTAIAGQMSFILTNRNALLYGIREIMAAGHSLEKPWLDREDAKPDMFGPNDVAAPIVNANDTNFTTVGVRRNDNIVASPVSETDPYVYVGEDNLNTSLIEDQIQMLPNHVGEIPPFTVTIVSSNEMGQSSVMKVHGVKLLAESYAISIDHITSDLVFDFIALSIDPWTPINRQQ